MSGIQLAIAEPDILHRGQAAVQVAVSEAVALRADHDTADDGVDARGCGKRSSGRGCEKFSTGDHAEILSKMSAAIFSP
jgi:hypothetical protein